MTIATIRSMSAHGVLPAILGSLVLFACTASDGDDVKNYVEDDDVKNYTVDDDSLEAVGAHRAALKNADAPPIAESIYTDAILAIAIAEEGKGPEEVGVSTGYPLIDYADDLTGGWCSEFASWAFWRGGCPFSGNNWGNYDWMLGGSTQIRQWFIDNSRFVSQTDAEWATFEPQPGDYIRYNTSGGGHSGIVRYVEGTTLYTVEGNVNNIVMLRSLRNYKTDYSDPIDGIDGFGVNPCGDGGAGGAAGVGGAGGEPPTSGGTGGDTSTGGAGGSGGSEPPGSGGEPGTGGAVSGSGGAGVGGSMLGSGGEPGTGGAVSGSGGAGVGGSMLGSGGAGVGGYGPGAGGEPPGSGGAPLGSGGAGVGGTPGSGGAGVGGTVPGTGGAVAGTGGALVGLGGAATGGSTAGPLIATGGQPGIAALGGAAGEASNEKASEESGCSCAVPGGARGGATRLAWSALGLLGLLLVRRRRETLVG
jgi:MYXO-CTERM domain-containing protein